MKTLRELREKTLTPAEKKKREEIAKAIEKDNPDMPMDKKMAIATATAKRVAESLDEGRMKELHGYIERGMSAQQIAKKMKLDVKTIQALMPKKESIEEDRKGMAKLAGLYSKAMRQMPGSPAQKKIKAEIDKLRKELGMNESLEEQKDDAEYNDEGGMAISQLKTAKSAVEELMSIIKDNDNLPEWVQSKLTKAVDYMDSVRDYMASEKGEVQEAVKTTHVVIDTADGNKVVATASDEKGAKSSVASAERPPMNIKNKKTLKIVKLKRPVGDKQVDRMVGYPLKEAVSPAQQAAIAIAKKEKGEKPEVKEAKKDQPYPFRVNIRGEGGATVKAKNMDDAVKKAFKELGIATRFMRDKTFMKKVNVHTKYTETNESRAYRDAMRGMKGNTKGMATTKKDKDIEATDDDRKAANKNIIMQLRKAADLNTGAEIDFERGKGKVTRDQAKATLARFNALSKPNEKEKFQKSIKSLADIKKILGR